MLGKLLPLLPLSLLMQPAMACTLNCTYQPQSALSVVESSQTINSSPTIEPSRAATIATLPATVTLPTELAVSAFHSQPPLQTSPFIDRSFGPLVPYVSTLFSSALPSQRTIFEDTFDSDLSNFKVDSGASDTHGAVIQADPLTSGNAVRLEVRRDDPISNNKLRSELVPAVNRDEFEFGTDYFYQFRIYLPPEWETDAAPDVVAQWHGRPDRDLGEPNRRPPLSFMVYGEYFHLVTRSDSARVNRTGEPGNTFTEMNAWRGPIERGRWIDWAFHIRWSYDSDGIIRIWKDGQHIHTHSGANAYNDRTPPFFKLGVYKWIWTRNPEQSSVDRRVVWLDDISIGILE